MDIQDQQIMNAGLQVRRIALEGTSDNMKASLLLMLAGASILIDSKKPDSSYAELEEAAVDIFRDAFNSYANFVQKAKGE